MASLSIAKLCFGVDASQQYERSTIMIKFRNLITPQTFKFYLEKFLIVFIVLIKIEDENVKKFS